MTIHEQLILVQRELKPIVKDSQNPHFRNKYFDINTLLEVVKPILNKHGLILTQALTHIDGKLALATTLSSSERLGKIVSEDKYLKFDQDIISSTCPLPECADAQKYGSAITYFRRYALQSLLALEAEDDDGNSSKSKYEMPGTKETIGALDKLTIRKDNDDEI